MSTSITELRNTLQSELQLILAWICENKLVLNVAKTKSIMFRARHATNNDNQLCVSLRGSDRFKRQIYLVSHSMGSYHGRNIYSCIRRSAAFLTSASRVLVTQALALSHPHLTITAPPSGPEEICLSSK